MKRTILFSVVALSLAATSCTVADIDPDEPENESTTVEMSFGATTLDDGTKTILDDYDSKTKKYPIFWNPADSINVFDVSASPNQTAKLRNQADTLRTSTTFKGLVTPSNTGYYALYPWQKINNAGLEDEDEWLGLINFDTTDDVPETLHLEWCGYNQNATAFGYDPTKAYMMAYTTSDTFSFKQVFSFVKFRISFDCSSVVFESNDSDEVLGCQDIWLQMKENVPVVVKRTLPGSGKKSVTLQSRSFNKENQRYVPAGTYLIAVLPQTLEKGFTITFNPTSISGSVSKSTTKSVELTRGNILNLGVFSTSDFGEFPTTGEWSGSGTSDNPYLITTVAQWNLLAERMNGKYSTYKNYYDKYYKLTQDLDCDGEIVSSVGIDMEQSFEGVFDGGGHTISNYYPSTADCVEALFGYIKSATIKNLTVKPAGFNGNYDGFSDFSFSPLVGVTTVDVYKSNKASVIENCHAEPLVKGLDPLTLTCNRMDMNYGSMVAWVRDRVTFMGCSNSIDVCLKSTSQSSDLLCAGGIAGKIRDCFVTDEPCVFDRCRNTGKIQVQSYGEAIGGGILGYDYDNWSCDPILRMSNCENRGEIEVSCLGWDKDDISYAGGLIGEHDSDGRLMTNGDPFVYNCLNAGTVVCNGNYFGYAGGFAAYCYDEDTVFCNCVSLWSPTGNASSHLFSFFTGGSYKGTFTHCFSYNDDFSDEELKDLAIFNDYRSSIPDHPDKATVFAEYEDNKIYQYCSWDGNLSSRTLKLQF